MGEKTFTQKAAFVQEHKLSSLFSAAAFIAIFIACLGLFGLSAFEARQRIKEIGIRKVLGASVIDITSLLSKDFVGPVIISLIIACPIAWWAIDKWLESFAYRTVITWWVFVSAGVFALTIAVITISYQTIKAARANPVKNLRVD